MSKILIFGDSFVGPFNLIKDKQIIITKFKGGTLKGILKPDNKNHKKMIKIINKFKNETKGIIFFFGSVDIHFSYYYNLLNGKTENNSISTVKKTVNDYYKMMLKIKNILNNKKAIISVINPFINPIEKNFKMVIIQLLSYRIITNKDLTFNNMQIISKNIKKANTFFFTYSNILKNRFSTSDKNIKYVNFAKETIDNINNPAKSTLNHEFKDFSVINIHLLYEPTLLLFIKNILEKYYNIKYNKKQIAFFLKDEYIYIKEKKEIIKKLIDKSDKEIKEMYTGEKDQIDYYSAFKKIDEFKSIFNKTKKSIFNKTKKSIFNKTKKLKITKKHN